MLHSVPPTDLRGRWHTGGESRPGKARTARTHARAMAAIPIQGKSDARASHAVRNLVVAVKV